MTSRVLDVYFHEQFAGRLSQDQSGRLSFSYLPDYLRSNKPSPLSVALPLQDQPFDNLASQAFFEGLLPEGDVRHQLARCLGIAENNIFALLAAVAGECAGAVALYAEGEKPKAEKDGFKILSDSEFEKILGSLTENPFLVNTDHVRLSLAGVQNKLPVVTLHHTSNEYTIALSAGMPTTDILKTPIPHYPDSIHNEFFCMQLAKLAEIQAADTHLKKFNHTYFLLVHRYDRLLSSTLSSPSNIKRLHQEDFCQALGIVPQMKYEEDNRGPSLLKCLALIKEYSTQPGADRLEFIKRIIFNYLIGNSDAHGKNFSLLYLGDMPQLAPAYDLLSTAVYPQLTTKMAMRIAGKSDPYRVLLRHWQKLTDGTPSAKKILENYLQFFATQLPTLAGSLEETLKQQDIVSPIFQKIKTVIQKRAKHILLYFPCS